jgi:hypothetical protein
MEINPIITPNESTMFPTTTTEPPTTTPVVINTHPFLQTTACQTIAGAFTWAAILITGYHVNKKTKRISLEILIMIYLDLSSFTVLSCSIGTKMDHSFIIHRSYLFVCFMVEFSDV